MNPRDRLATLMLLAALTGTATGSEPQPGVEGYVDTLTEEARLPALESAHPDIAFRALVAALPADDSRRDPLDAGRALWRSAVAHVQSGRRDDRPLYWARLALRGALRAGAADASAAFEWSSRGMDDVAFDPAVPNRVLITGFDPFGLDEQLNQSNPSGLAVLALDGLVLETARGPVQVQGALIPVRFADFDQGLIETFLTPRLTDSRLDLVLTISMGREAFDLERFPGRRRSAAVPDNLNVRTGASQAQPLVPMLAGAELAGPEFLEFTLPADAMTAIDAPFTVRDNRTVRTLERGELIAGALTELDGQTAVAGSGGGYLSNEIAYRSLLANQRSGSGVPMGHLHTPRVSGYDEAVEWQIVEQIRRLIITAVEVLPERQPGFSSRKIDPVTTR